MAKREPFSRSYRRWISLFGGPVASYIGGEILMTVVSADCVEGLSIYQWLSEVGKPINVPIVYVIAV